jgi:uncharacterized protein involved in exopolysaccharide biosynthesis
MEAILLVIRRHLKLAIGVFLFAWVAILLVHLLSPRVYEVQTSFYIQRQIANQYHEQDYDDLLDHIRILKSDLVLDRIIEQLKRQFPKRKGIDHELLLKRLRADSSISGSESGPTTKVVDLTFQDTDPKFAKSVLDDTLDAYKAALEYIARETRLNGIKLLNDRLKIVQEQRMQNEQILQKQETLSGTTDIELKNAELVKLKSNFVQMLGTVNAELNATEQQITHLRKILGLSPEDVRRLAGMRTDPKLDNWQKQLAVEKAELTKLKSMYTDNHPSVLEKEDAVLRLQMLIDQRMRTSFGDQPIVGAIPNFSEMDATLGKQLIDLTTQQAALTQQKLYYEQYLNNLSKGSEQVAFEKKDMTDLRLALNALQSEEEKLQEKIQDATLEQANLLNLGSFVVLSPPVLPDKDDVVFPMSLKLTLLLGFAASLLLALFSVGVAEFLDPRIILFEKPATVLGEFNGKSTQTPEDIYGELSQIYQNIALLAKKSNLKIITFLDLFGSLNPKNSLPVYQDEPGKKQLLDYWTPGGYAPALAGLFAQKHLKILLVSCAGLNSREASLFNPFRNKTLTYELDDIQLYRSQTQNNLFLLIGRGSGEAVLDPYMLEKIQEFQAFDLILIHRVLSAEPEESHQSAARQQAKLAQVQALSDSMILGISKAGSNVRQLQEVQRLARQDQLLGSIVFP